MTTKKLTAIEEYRRQTADAKIDTIELTAPSGAKFIFQRPSKFRLLFEYGVLPQKATGVAVGSWINDGILKAANISEDVEKTIDIAARIGERVLELSYRPKLIMGEPEHDYELPARLVHDDDMQFLFEWVASGGGDVSGKLGNFPARSDADPVAGNNGSKRRASAKRASGRHG